MKQEEIFASIFIATTVLMVLVITIIITMVQLHKKNVLIVSLNKSIDNLNLQLFPPMEAKGVNVTMAMVASREFVDHNGFPYEAVLTKEFLENTQFIYVRYYNELDIRELHMFDMDKNLAVISRPLEYDYKVVTIDEIFPVNVKTFANGYTSNGIFLITGQHKSVTEEVFAKTIAPDSSPDKDDETDVG